MEHFDLDYYGRLRDLPNDVIAREFEWRYPERANAAIEVCDRHAQEGRGLAIRWLGIDGSTRDVTYTEARATTNRVANMLARHGVEEGDRVFTVLPRIPEHWLVLMGAWKVGAITSCLSTTFAADAFAVRIRDARPKVVVTIAKHRDRVAPACREVGALLVEVDDDGPEGLHDRLSSESEEFTPIIRGIHDAAFLFYTSGTTGPPKGSVHSTAQLVGGLALNAVALDVRPDDVYWPTPDLGWVAGFILTFSALCQGVPFLAVESDFDADLYWLILAKEEVTNLFAVPTFLRMLRRREAILVEEEGLTLSLRRGGSVGEALDPATLQWAKERLGITVFEWYGQTEHGAGACTNRPGYEIRPGSLGLPFPYLDLRILDEDGNEVPRGEEGEIVTKADYPALFKGYYNQLEKTAETLRGDGWHRTGDLAHMDSDGYVWFHSRKDDVISSGGYRIGPSEVEGALLAHPAVRDAAVVGKPDEVRGQIVKAWVVADAPSDALAAELQQYCRDTAGGWNYPREVEFIAELPRTATGKVRRVELREIDAQRAKAEA